MPYSHKTATADHIKHPESNSRPPEPGSGFLSIGSGLPRTQYLVPGTKNHPASSAQHHIQILRDLRKNPYISQREIAIKNRISLGKVNYAIRSLLDKGYIKIQNFKNAKNKRQYTYFLTPAGMSETAKRTSDFLKWKMEEYERIRLEIRELEQDLQEQC